MTKGYNKMENIKWTPKLDAELDQYIKEEWVKAQVKRHGEGYRKEATERINQYIIHLALYPLYAEQCSKATKERLQKYGGVNPPNLSQHPDHDYAARMSGVYSDFVLILQEHFIANLYQKMREENEISEFLKYKSDKIDDELIEDNEDHSED